MDGKEKLETIVKPETKTERKFKISADAVGRILCITTGVGLILYGAFSAGKIEHCLLGGAFCLVSVLPGGNNNLYW
jgi:hypothetical protein